MTCPNFEVLCLQKHPEYYEQTITLLNNQWPRSRTARLRSLEQGSKDGLPVSLVLVQKETSCREDRVIAHSKISPIPYKPQMCFVESVVVAPELRGKGLGRLIMHATEDYVRTIGVTTVYLTTFDQQDFYHKLGYNFTDPIVVFGGSSKLVEKADDFHSALRPCLSRVEQPVSAEENVSNTLKAEISRCRNVLPLSVSSTLPPPPPPPPPPFMKIAANNNNIITAPKLTMRKFLKRDDME